MSATLIEPSDVGLSLPAPARTDVVCEQPLLLWLPEIDGLRPWFAMAHARTESASLEDWVADELARQQRTLEVPWLVAHNTLDHEEGPDQEGVLQTANGKARRQQLPTSVLFPNRLEFQFRPVESKHVDPAVGIDRPHQFPAGVVHHAEVVAGVFA